MSESIFHIRSSRLFVPRDFDVSPWFAIVKPSLAPDFDFHHISGLRSSSRVILTKAPSVQCFFCLQAVSKIRTFAPAWTGSCECSDSLSRSSETPNKEPQRDDVKVFSFVTVRLLSILISGLYLTACDKAPEFQPVESPPQARSEAKTQAHRAEPTIGKRERECDAAPMRLGYCSLNSWGGPEPMSQILGASSSAQTEKWEGLLHILKNGNLTRRQIFFDKQTGACGEVAEGSAVYRGSSYSGTFYCDKSQYLATPSDIENKTLTAENFLVGKWTKTDKPKASWSEDKNWEFFPDGTSLQDGHKYYYAFFGRTFATKSSETSTWSVYEITEISQNKLTVMLAAPPKTYSSGYEFTKLSDSRSTTVPSGLPSFSEFEPYGEFRRRLLSERWVPYISPDASKCDADDERCQGRPEMEYCTSSGAIQCRFLWRRENLRIVVITVGEDRASVINVEAE